LIDAPDFLGLNNMLHMVVGHLEYWCVEYIIYSTHNPLNSSRDRKGRKS
jgi:hypothetical protein